MAVQDLEREFAERAVDRHGIKLLRPADAAEYVARCGEQGIEVLGIDGFRLDGDKIQPLMEHSIGLSVSPSPGKSHQKAADFLMARIDSGLWFEVLVDR